MSASRPIPFFMLAMVKWAYGPGSTIEFVEIPERHRARFAGHGCIAQVRVPVGSLPGDRHFFHASGADCLEALRNLLGSPHGTAGSL